METPPTIYQLLEPASVAFALTVIFYAAWSDWKTRIVSDRVWIFTAPVGATLTAIRSITLGVPSLYFWLVGTALTVTVSFALAYFRFWGGADSKALIFLALTLPVMPGFVRPILGLWIAFLPFTVLFNTYLLSTLSVVHNLVRNLYYKLKGGKLFEDFESEPIHVKAFALFVAYKVDKAKVASSHSTAIAVAEKNNNGRKFKFTIRWDEQEEADFNRLPAKVWVTPQLPLIVFMAGGLTVALTLGDIPLWVVVSLLQALVL